MGRSIRPAQLHAMLQKSLEPLYVLVSDERLLQIEAADTIRAALRSAGVTERQVFVGDARAPWSDLLSLGSSGSLFGGSHLTELQLPTGKPGKAGGDAIIAWSHSLGPGHHGLVTMPAPDSTTRKAAWYLALLEAGTVVEIPAIRLNQLPDWITQRFAQQGQQISDEAAQWMATQVEGNLLAAHQEIRRIGLIESQGALSDAVIRHSVANVARYDIEGLREALRHSDHPRLARLIAGLQAEDAALPLVIWAVSEELRALQQLAEARARGQSENEAARALRLFGPREQALKALSRRADLPHWNRCLSDLHAIDRMAKGVGASDRITDPWTALLHLCLCLDERAIHV